MSDAASLAENPMQKDTSGSGVTEEGASLRETHLIRDVGAVRERAQGSPGKRTFQAVCPKKSKARGVRGRQEPGWADLLGPWRERAYDFIWSLEATGESEHRSGTLGPDT